MFRNSVPASKSAYPWDSTIFRAWVHFPLHWIQMRSIFGFMFYNKKTPTKSNKPDSVPRRKSLSTYSRLYALARYIEQSYSECYIDCSIPFLLHRRGFITGLRPSAEALRHQWTFHLWASCLALYCLCDTFRTYTFRYMYTPEPLALLLSEDVRTFLLKNQVCACFL